MIFNKIFNLIARVLWELICQLYDSQVLFFNVIVRMLTDELFVSEKKPLKKLALGLTIPCAILPILMSVYGIINLPIAPLLFKYDFLIIIISFYTWGLILSFAKHKKILPFLFFTCSMISVINFLFSLNAEIWVPLSIVTIIASSVSNQYFRIDTEDCVICLSDEI